MSNRVSISRLEDSRKLVDAWMTGRGVWIEKISEDTEDNLMWMTLCGPSGRLQLRRDLPKGAPLNLLTRAEEVWNTLDKVPGSPYRVEDNCFHRGEEAKEEVISLYEGLWAKYWDPNWKNLDFLLTKREPEVDGVDVVKLLSLIFVTLISGLVLASVLLVWILK